MSVYVTDTLDKLRETEQLLKVLYGDTVSGLVISPVHKMPSDGRCIAHSCGVVEYQTTDIVYKNIRSLLETEVIKLKQELREKLDLADVEKMDFE